MNKKISIPIALTITIFLAVLFLVSLFYYLKPDLGNINIPIFSKKYCSFHNDCSAVLGCGGCSWDCVNKNNYKPGLCNPLGPKCEMAPPPQNKICGCINNKCEFSEELFDSYTEIKNKALNLVVSDYKGAVNLCNQLHGQDFFECYSKIAEKMLPINTAYADEICSYTMGKYYEGVTECYSSLARKIVVANPNLAIEFCSKADVGPACSSCINYRAFCVRDISLEIAKNDNLLSALKACDIPGIDDPVDYCKFFIIQQSWDEGIGDPNEAFRKIVESDICEKANFPESYYYENCETIYSIINATILAQNKKIKEAIDYCDKISEKIVIGQVYGAKYDCYKKVAIAISEYDTDSAKEICNKMPEGSGIKIECNQEIKK